MTCNIYYKNDHLGLRGNMPVGRRFVCRLRRNINGRKDIYILRRKDMSRENIKAVLDTSGLLENVIMA